MPRKPDEFLYLTAAQVKFIYYMIWGASKKTTSKRIKTICREIMEQIEGSE